MIAKALDKKFYSSSSGGTYIKSIVYGGLDGIITTFAVVAGVSGAALSSNIILILGFANLVADGLSMSIGDYLSTKAEQEYEAKNSKRKKKGLSAKKSGMITFVSFLCFGFVPLATYVFAPWIPAVQAHSFVVASVLTGLTLFLLGVFKSRILGSNSLKSGLEVLGVGGIAAVAAFLIGKFVAGLV